MSINAAKTIIARLESDTVTAASNPRAEALKTLKQIYTLLHNDHRYVKVVAQMPDELEKNTRETLSVAFRAFSKERSSLGTSLCVQAYGLMILARMINPPL